MYVLIEKQLGDGCDHTIGCGVRVTALKAMNLEAARAEARSELREYVVLQASNDSYAQEVELNYAQIAEVVADVPLNQWIADERERIVAEVRDEAEAREHAEYERLRSKFGG